MATEEMAAVGDGTQSHRRNYITMRERTEKGQPTCVDWSEPSEGVRHSTQRGDILCDVCAESMSGAQVILHQRRLCPNDRVGIS